MQTNQLRLFIVCRCIWEFVLRIDSRYICVVVAFVIFCTFRARCGGIPQHTII